MENEKSKDGNKQGALKPNSETLHTTDPQEHMEGPISSLMQKAEKGFEEDDNGTAEKEDKK